jgi:hypothetical protein
MALTDVKPPSNSDGSVVVLTSSILNEACIPTTGSANNGKIFKTLSDFASPPDIPLTDVKPLFKSDNADVVLTSNILNESSIPPTYSLHNGKTIKTLSEFNSQAYKKLAALPDVRTFPNAADSVDVVLNSSTEATTEVHT